MVFEVEAEPAEIEKSLSTAYRHLVNRVAVPGFRTGKAPREMLERHIGKGPMLEEALEHLVPELLGKAIDEAKIDVIAKPQIEITNIEPVKFKATVSLPPTIELGNYQELRLEKETVSVTEEEINRVVEQVRMQSAVLEPVDRPVKFDDMVTLDLFGKAGDEQLIDKKDLPIRVVKDMPVPVPGFPEQIEGMTKGQEKEFTIAVPEDFAAKKVAGKSCYFKAKVTEIKEQRLPEINDDLAKSMGDGSETMEAMRKNILTNLTNLYEAGAARRYEQKVLEAVADMSKIEFPPILVEQEVQRAIEEQEHELEERRVTLQDYLKSQQKTIEELRKSLRPMAKKQIAVSLVIGEVVMNEKLQATPEEIESEINRVSASAGEQAEELRKVFQSPESKTAIARTIMAGKAVKMLMDIASSGAKTAAPVAEESAEKKAEPAEGESK
jgi:trigger factor